MWVREYSFFSIYEKRSVVKLVWDLSPEYNSFPKWVVNMNHNAISDLGSRTRGCYLSFFKLDAKTKDQKDHKSRN
jgi:hypothetical protein